MPIINNIGFLRNDLISHGWHMTAFGFHYNGEEYDVLFENNEDIKDRKNKYATVVLHFIDTGDPNRVYSVESNQAKMFFEPKAFREYFRIQYANNLGDIFQQFFSRFLTFVPQSVPVHLNERQNLEIDHCLAGRGGHDPNAIYCYDARRLGKNKMSGKQEHRSIFISNLTQRRKPALYAKFENETTVTFYYSPNPLDELEDIAIIDKFVQREKGCS